MRNGRLVFAALGLTALTLWLGVSTLGNGRPWSRDPASTRTSAGLGQPEGMRAVTRPDLARPSGTGVAERSVAGTVAGHTGRAGAEGAPSFLTGRVFVDDRPLVQGEVRLETGWKTPRGVERACVAVVETDTDARFRTPEPLLRELGEELYLEVRVGEAHGTRLWTEALRRIELSTPLSEGENDLGRLDLSSGAVWVSGTVRNEDGRPVRGAKLTVAPLAGQGVQPVFHVGRDGWSVRSLSDGSFRVQHRPGDASVQMLLLVEHRHYPTRTVEFVAGRRNLEVVLERGVAVVGAVLVDDPRMLDLLELELHSVPAHAMHESKTAHPRRSDGLFVLHDVSRGTYELRVSQVDRLSPMLARQEFVAERPQAGELVLPSIDLRGRVTLAEIQCEPVNGGAITIHVTRLGAWPQAPETFAGRAPILCLLEDPQDYFVETSQGGAVVRGLTGDVRVEVSPLVRLELTVPFDLELDEAWMEARLEPVDAQRARGASSVTGEEGRFSFNVLAGRFHLSLRLFRGDRFVRLGTPRQLDLREGIDLELELDPDELGLGDAVRELELGGGEDSSPDRDWLFDDQDR